MNGKQLTMELDTGAAVSIISKGTRKELFPKQEASHVKHHLEDLHRGANSPNRKPAPTSDQVAKLALVVLLEKVPA